MGEQGSRWTLIGVVAVSRLVELFGVVTLFGPIVWKEGGNLTGIGRLCTSLLPPTSTVASLLLDICCRLQFIAACWSAADSDSDSDSLTEVIPLSLASSWPKLLFAATYTRLAVHSQLIFFSALNRLFFFCFAGSIWASQWWRSRITRKSQKLNGQRLSTYDAF